MENRKLTIEFLGIEWFIETPDYDDTLSKGIGIIAPITAIRDGKIVRIFDIFTPSEEEIDNVKKLKEFYEVCHFTHDKHEFTGSFIDALEYIKEHFKEKGMA